MKIHIREGRSIAGLRRRRQAGQGMVEYGLVVGMLSAWVIILFVALKPIFTEKFASENILRYSGEGRTELASNLGVTFASDAVVIDDGGGGGDAEGL